MHHHLISHNDSPWIHDSVYHIAMSLEFCYSVYIILLYELCVHHLAEFHFTHQQQET